MHDDNQPLPARTVSKSPAEEQVLDIHSVEIDSSFSVNLDPTRAVLLGDGDRNIGCE